MKTTRRIPERQFVTEAPEEKLRAMEARESRAGAPAPLLHRVFITFGGPQAHGRSLTVAVPGRPPWRQSAGRLRHLPRDTVRINRAIELEFERCD